MNIYKSLINYITYRYNALFVKSIPLFAGDFMRNVLNDNTLYPEYKIIEKIRLSLESNTDLIISTSYGAGTRSYHRKRTIGIVAKSASVSTKYGRLLFRIARHFRPLQILELGTGLGISTLYMALGNPDAGVLTVEGNTQLVKTATCCVNEAGLKNVTIINKEFDNVLKQLISSLKDNVMIFIDGNHTYEATIRYFNSLKGICSSSVIMIFDDINWSDEMMQAWKEIRNSRNTGLKIDLFKMGILFKIPGLSEQNLQIFY
jgi:predicted O-methyltransferase YrrM